MKVWKLRSPFDASGRIPTLITRHEIDSGYPRIFLGSVSRVGGGTDRGWPCSRRTSRARIARRWSRRLPNRRWRPPNRLDSPSRHPRNSRFAAMPFRCWRRCSAKPVLWIWFKRRWTSTAMNRSAPRRAMCSAIADRCWTGCSSYRPVVAGEEGSSVDIPAGFDAGRFRLTGNVAGEPPFRGSLVHHGWEAARCTIPQWAGSDEAARVVAPAEVQLP
jgi:hypothetical protein